MSKFETTEDEAAGIVIHKRQSDGSVKKTTVGAINAGKKRLAEKVQLKKGTVK